MSMGRRGGANLDMRIAMLQAKSGQRPRLGVAKYLRQKARKSGRGGRGTPPKDEHAVSALSELMAVRRQHKVHHAVKQLRQAVKKAKAFELRKLVRRLKQAPEPARAKGAKAASVAAEAGSWPAVFLGVQTKRARVRMAILGRWSGRCAAEQ